MAIFVGEICDLIIEAVHYSQHEEILSPGPRTHQQHLDAMNRIVEIARKVVPRNNCRFVLASCMYTKVFEGELILTQHDGNVCLGLSGLGLPQSISPVQIPAVP